MRFRNSFPSPPLLITFRFRYHCACTSLFKFECRVPRENIFFLCVTLALNTFYIFIFSIALGARDRVMLFIIHRRKLSQLSICEQCRGIITARRDSQSGGNRGFPRLNRRANETANETKLREMNQNYTARSFVRVLHFSSNTEYTCIHTLVKCNPFHYDEAHKHAWMNDSAWGCMYRRVYMSECVCAWGKYRRQIYKPVCCNWAFSIARGLKENVYDHKNGREREREREKARERERVLYTRTYHDYVYCIR